MGSWKTPEDRLKFKNILAATLDIDSDLVSILEVKEGSIKLTIELPLESAEKLISLFHKKDVALDQLQSEFEIKKIDRLVKNETSGVTYPKTIHLLLSLNNKERSKFSDYLNSPYFNTNGTLLKLYNVILQEFSSNKKVYSENDLMKKTYGKSNIRKYKFDLQKLKKHFERFIALQCIDQQEHLYNRFTLEDYLFRNNGSFFEQQYKKTKKELENRQRDIFHHQHQLQIEVFLENYLNLYKDKRVGDTNLQVVSNTIDSDFLVKKLTYLLLMHNRQNITKITYDFGFTANILDHLNKKTIIEDPLINLLYQVYQVLEGINIESAFENVILLLKHNDQKIAKEMALVLSIILQNNLKRVYEHEAENGQQLFDLYTILLDKNYIQDRGKLPVNFYKNVISIGLGLDKFDYVEQFIETYKNKLQPEDIGKKVYAFNKAIFLFYKGEFSKARKLVRNLNFKDTIDRFNLKCLEIMLSFESREYVFLEFQINSFAVALTPKRSPYFSKKNTYAYRNFIHIIKKLYRILISPESSQNDIQRLIDFIQKTNHLPYRKWLLNKANKLLM